MTSNARKNFQRNLNKFLQANKMNQVELGARLGVSSATTSDWCTGKKVPQMDRIEEIGNILGVTTSMMLADEEDVRFYYLDREAREIAGEISRNKDLRLLFESARDINSADLLSITNILKALKKKEKGDDAG